MSVALIDKEVELSKIVIFPFVERRVNTKEMESLKLSSTVTRYEVLVNPLGTVPEIVEELAVSQELVALRVTEEMLEEESSAPLSVNLSRGRS